MLISKITIFSFSSTFSAILSKLIIPTSLHQVCTQTLRILSFNNSS
uniref:Uncharacterized protein n=1 Tax=Anguilla anguilla TaxID=7936 RepID=A0A0E9X094_ANGAN